MIRTRSATFFADTFCMMFARWNSTVLGLMPNVSPATLLVAPCMMSSSTALSLGVRSSVGVGYAIVRRPYVPAAHLFVRRRHGCLLRAAIALQVLQVLLALPEYLVVLKRTSNRCTQGEIGKQSPSRGVKNRR
jgi:hypothetical protein